jgi:hypothetical protein
LLFFGFGSRDDVDAVGVEIDLSAAAVAELGEKLESTHASSVVSMIAQALVLIVPGDLRVEHLVELAGNRVITEICGIEQDLPVGFFFMRFRNRAPSVEALASLASGWTT